MAGIAALSGLAFSTSSKSSSPALSTAPSSGIEGGWSFTAYSNREPYARAMVSAFGSQMRAAKMDDLGVYPGNAQDSMIEKWSDSAYVEQGNLAYIQCHGNPYEIALSYEPVTSGLSQYRWGEDGRLQWLIVGGCDVLGYSRLPDGSPAPNSYYYPALSRWNDAFQGISGILGYRSASFYQVNNTGIPSMASAVLVQELQAGHTFVASWLAASSYVHNVLNHQAEAAVLASSASALSDTLVSFVEERPIGLDLSAVRRVTVGRGPSPQYDYEEVVQAGPMPAIQNKRPLPQITAKVAIRQDLKIPSITLPTFRIEAKSHSELAKVTASLKLRELYAIELSSENAFTTYLADSSITIDSLKSILPKPANYANATQSPDFQMGYVESTLTLLDGIKQLNIASVVSNNSSVYPIFEYGMTIDYRDNDNVVRVGNLWLQKDVAGQITIEVSEAELALALEGVSASFEKVIVDQLAIGYAAFDSPEKRLEPVLAAYCTFVQKGQRAHIQIMIRGK
jgi:Family of unknown function (DUF6345)